MISAHKHKISFTAPNPAKRVHSSPTLFIVVCIHKKNVLLDVFRSRNDFVRTPFAFKLSNHIDESGLVDGEVSDTRPAPWPNALICQGACIVIEGCAVVRESFGRHSRLAVVDILTRQNPFCGLAFESVWKTEACSGGFTGVAINEENSETRWVGVFDHPQMCCNQVTRHDPQTQIVFLTVDLKEYLSEMIPVSDY